VNTEADRWEVIDSSGPEKMSAAVDGPRLFTTWESFPLVVCGSANSPTIGTSAMIAGKSESRP